MNLKSTQVSKTNICHGSRESRCIFGADFGIVSCHRRSHLQRLRHMTAVQLFSAANRSLTALTKAYPQARISLENVLPWERFLEFADEFENKSELLTS